MIEFRLLGPVEVRVADRTLAVRRPQQCAVLAALAVDAGCLVPVEVLIDRVWGTGSPGQARRALHAHVARIRGQLADQVAGPGARPVELAGRTGGYLLAVDPERVDLHRFRRLVERARASGCAEPRRAGLLREALDLWHGQPLAGVPGEWAERTRHGWERQRLDALLAWGRAELLVGDPDPVIDRLADVAAEHPLVEPLTVLLMRALCASGRGAEALDCYARTRQRLADELGVDPGAELRALHKAILQGQLEPSPPALVPPTRTGPAPDPPAPALLPPDVSGFAGRETMLARLDAVLDSVTDQPTAVVISTVSGTAGVGKTTLAVHWAHRMVDRFPDGQLYVNLYGFGPARPPVPPAEAVQAFLSALAVPPDRIPPTPAAQIGLYRSLLAGRRVLVMLDNACDADQVRPLLPGAPGCLALVTSRDQLSSLVVAEGAYPLTLDVLDPAEARQLLERRLGAGRVAAEPGATDDIIGRCAGLPLALAVVAARAAAHPRFSLRALADDLREAAGVLDTLANPDATADVRTVLSWSYHAIKSDAARLFRLLALHPGPDLTAPAAAGLAGIPLALARRQLAELAQANLVTEPAPGRYGLHDLLRAYATELVETTDTGADRWAALRRLFDHYLHTAHTATALVDPQRLPLGPRSAPMPTGSAPLSGTEPLTTRRQGRAWLTAERAVLVASVSHAAATGFDGHAWRLAWALFLFLDRCGHWEDAVLTQRTGLAAAQRLADPAGQAYLHRYLGLALARQHRWQDAKHHLERAIDQLASIGESAGRSAAHLTLGAICERQDRADQSLHHAQQALELAGAAGHRMGQARALDALGWSYLLLGDYQAAIRFGQRALAMHQEIDDDAGTASAWDTLGCANDRLGDHRRAITCYQRALALYDRVDVRLDRGETLSRLGDAYLAAGDRTAARDAWRSALDIFDEFRAPAADELRAKLSGKHTRDTGR